MCPGSALQNLRIAAGNKADLDRKKAHVERLASALGREIPARHLDEWRNALVRIRTARVRDCLSRIEANVGMLRHLHDERQRGAAAGMTPKQILSKEKSASTQLEKATNELEQLREVKHNGQPLPDPEGVLQGLPTRWTKEEIKRLIAGDNLWMNAHSLGRDVHKRLLVARFHAANSEVRWEGAFVLAIAVACCPRCCCQPTCCPK